MKHVPVLAWTSIVGIFAWPVAGLVLVGSLWWATASRIDGEMARGRQAIELQAYNTADAYAAQLTQTIQQIDQIVQNLKFDQEDPGVHVNLERKWLRGIFPRNNSLFATIAGPDGRMITSTLVTGTAADFADTTFFQAHRDDCCLGLLISRPELAKRLGKPVIRFSRRLETAEGRFDGIAFVSIEPSYLFSYQARELAATDFVSVRLTSGPLLATRVGPHLGEVRVFYRQDPHFDGEQGVRHDPATAFRDGVARVVAWKKLRDYPLVALASYSEAGAFAPYRQVAATYRQNAVAGTILLALLSIGGMYFTARLAWRRQAEENVRETYRMATDAANEGFYMLRPVYGPDRSASDFILEDCNDHGAALIGAVRGDLVGRPVSELQPASYRDELLALCRRALEYGIQEGEVRVHNDSPVQARWIYQRIVRSAHGLALTVRDITEAKEHEEALASLANTDALTALPNRRWLGSYLPTAIHRAELAHERLAVLFIDLDNFKNVNDTLGHEAGDELIRQAARRLKSAVRASDYVVRLGGDEFTVVLEHIDVMDDVARLARAIVRTLSEPYALAAGTGNDINASIGISMYPEDGTDADTLLKHADIAMYAAKAAGKGRHHFYQAHLSDRLTLRMTKERALREAIERDEFIVHYQPRVGLQSGTLCSMEALVRWMHPERGLVYPAEFIEVAEEMGIIVRLGEIVIDKVCAQLAAWRMQGMPPLPVSINVSPHQLRRGHVADYLARQMEAHGVDAHLVGIELTESAVVENSPQVARELAQLREMGVKLMIDDFGTGYSSLAQLQRIDVDILKVDRAFTRSLTAGAEGEPLFRAILSMAGALNMCVVAEGVETADELATLQSLDCDEIQGHVVSQAVDASDMTQLILKRYLLPPAGRAALLKPVR